MTIAVCIHGRKIDVKFLPAGIGGGFYIQTAEMPMCKDCILEATMEAMERACESFASSPLTRTKRNG